MVYQLCPLRFSFCRYFNTPYTTVPATNRATVGVNDGYRYLTKNLSHSSGRKPEAARRIPCKRMMPPSPSQARRKALSFLFCSLALISSSLLTNVGFSTGTRLIIVALSLLSLCFFLLLTLDLLNVDVEEEEEDEEEPNPSPDELGFLEGTGSSVGSPFRLVLDLTTYLMLIFCSPSSPSLSLFIFSPGLFLLVVLPGKMAEANLVLFLFRDPGVSLFSVASLHSLEA